MSAVKTYSEQIIVYIKDAILTGKLHPGDKVNEVVVATELSISRAPVREALQMLVKEGLITSIPQRGKFITALTAKQIRDSYFTGGVLEGAAVSSTISEFSEKDFENLQHIVDDMKKVVEHGENGTSMAELDDRFHDILFSKNTNDLISELARRSCQGISKFLLFRYWKDLFTLEAVYERHNHLLEVLRSRDVVAIENAIREHYIESGKRMERYGVDVLEDEA
ncbi:GntR family transcriptional regulator [Halodesulfovibrio marinisediminis]|uniref:Transcriptional regulator, GntR family n=1 Tax=Halodesulfovibrio marinisediminis DSM 17456 TaxID=1121457 RepID=A0A1N6J8V7_9BACT|nr:GntR family transcriptional regulator [Halodesulfovibrio marinisediminis]SIO40707.1 transcriptional regulator, GntR family [Halodesulfovibrio marinisediminis DSM 17456]